MARHQRTRSTVDQLLSSAQNILVTVIVARMSPAADFGAFALAMMVSVLVIGFAEAVLGEPFLVSAQRVKPGPPASVERAIVIAAAVLGVLLACLVMLSVLVVQPAMRASLAAAAVAIPCVVTQDVARYALLATNRAGTALFSDLVWTLTWLVTVAWTTPTSAPAHLLAWGVTSLPGLAVILPKLRRRSGERFMDVAGLRRLVATLSITLSVEFLGMTAASNLTIIAISSTSGLVVAGALRVAFTLFGPLNTLANAVRVSLMPEFARIRADYGRTPVGRLASISLASAALGLVVGVGSRAVPGAVGQAVFGDTWCSVGLVLTPVCIERAAAAGNLGVLVGLRVFGDPVRTLRVRAVATVIGSVLAICVNAWVGLTPAIYCLAAASVGTVIFLWRELLTSSRLGVDGVSVPIAHNDCTGTAPS